MKKISIIIVTALTVVLAPSSVMGQTAKSTLPGNAFMTHNGQYAALTVDGTTVLNYDARFVDFKTDNGIYFAAQKADGSFRLIDRKGKVIELGGLGDTYDKISIIDGTIVATKNGKTKYYSVNDPSKEIKVEQAGADFFDKGRDFNPEKMTRSKATAEAERLSALVAPEGRFEIRQKANSQRQEVVVYGKVVHEAQEYTVLSDETWWQEKGFWVLVAKNSGKYGVVGIDAYADDKTGEWHSGATQFIPYEYTFASNHDGTGPMITCTTMSGARTHFNYYGWNFDHDYRTGKYTGTKKRWVYDEATEKWTLRAAADGEQLRYTKWTPDKATGKLTLTNK